MSEQSQLIAELLKGEFKPEKCVTETIDYDATGQKLRDLRKALNVTIEEVAGLAKLHPPHLMAIERGDTWSGISFEKATTALRQLALIQQTFPQETNR